MLQKTPLSINFSQGLDTKTDPYQVQMGKFQSLENSIFDKGGQLTKRNGYGALTVLPDASNTFLTTFNGDLTAIGTTINAFSMPTNQWVNKGNIQPITLTTLPLIRSNTNQSQLDATVSANGLVCTVFTDNPPTGIQYKYVIADAVTGQNIVAPTLIPTGIGAIPVGVVTGSPRVFVLGSYFVIIFTNLVGAASHLDYIAISTSNPLAAPIPGEITSSYVPATTLSWDAVVYSNVLYVSYNNITGGQNISIKALTSNLILGAAHIFAGEICTMMSMYVDVTVPSIPVIWAAYYNLAGSLGRAFAVFSTLATALAPTTITAVPLILNITCVAINGILTFLLEVTNNYGYDAAIPTHFLLKGSLTQAGVLTPATVLVRSVGLASKAIIYGSTFYFMSVYQSVYQPTYFLMNALGQVISRLGYSNSGGYDTVGLPSVTLTNGLLQIGYLTKDLLSATNKSQAIVLAAINPGITFGPTNPVYSQLGLNLVSFNLAVDNVDSSEIGSNLNLTGGFVSGYDGYTITEQNFFVWPDNVEVTTSAAGGGILAGTYYYQVTYEWADNAGNVFRSAPSIPVFVVTTGATSTNTINVPTLRLTYKTANPVKIVVYRWSVAQQVYYALASPAAPPIFNNLTVDFLTIVDVLPDAAIIGNPILYTTGGVIEDTAPPSTSIMTLFNNRLWLVDAEDTNLLFFSKQVIEDTPVEMSDLLTLYIAPTTGSQGSTGPITALSPMDDKLIIFKKDASGYINGIGPDNTGANSTYSDFILITSVVGCTNQKSIVFTPLGLMFQSDKGIWLLGRDLSTTYIGAPVESLTTDATVLSALNIPTTNQVRFTMSTGITLMYDYYYNQWGTFVNVPSISSAIYNNLHTYIDVVGRVFQETPGIFLDNSNPVLMSFISGWANLAGLQGFQRFYFLYLLGTYYTPFKLNVQLAYDYNSSYQQSTLVTPRPSVVTKPWGNDQLWGSSTPWGGAGNVFEARLFPQIQKCESFQISINEVYDASFGIQPGAGLTLSGMNIIIGAKKGYRTQTAGQSFG